MSNSAMSFKLRDFSSTFPYVLLIQKVWDRKYWVGQISFLLTYGSYPQPFYLTETIHTSQISHRLIVCLKILLKPFHLYWFACALNSCTGKTYPLLDLRKNVLNIKLISLTLFPIFQLKYVCKCRIRDSLVKSALHQALSTIARALCNEIKKYDSLCNRAIVAIKLKKANETLFCCADSIACVKQFWRRKTRLILVNDTEFGRGAKTSIFRTM